MESDLERRIRERAYEIWVREGGSHGRHAHHWEQAQAEIAAEDAAREREATGAEAGASERPAAGVAPVRSRRVASRLGGGANGSETATPQQVDNRTSGEPAGSDVAGGDVAGGDVAGGRPMRGRRRRPST